MQRENHPSAFAPATLILLVVLGIFGAIIGIQLLVSLGVTPNTALRLARVLGDALEPGDKEIAFGFERTDLRDEADALGLELQNFELVRRRYTVSI